MIQNPPELRFIQKPQKLCTKEKFLFAEYTVKQIMNPTGKLIQDNISSMQEKPNEFVFYLLINSVQIRYTVISRH